MKSAQKGFSLAIFVLVIAIVGLAIGLSFYLKTPAASKIHINIPTQDQVKDIPESMKLMADDYLKSLVGEEVFRRDFKFDNSRFDESEGSDQATKFYTLHYHYSKLDKIGPEERVRIIIQNNQIFQNDPIAPRCVKDPIPCDFKIDLNQAVQIAKQNGFDVSDLVATYDPISYRSYNIQVDSCSQNKKMKIDIISGQVVSFDPYLVCTKSDELDLW